MSQPGNTVSAWADARAAAEWRVTEANLDDNPRRDPQKRIEAAYLQIAIARSGR